MKLNRVQVFETFIASLLMFTPFILKMMDGYYRTSISDYAYSEYSFVFVGLLAKAGMLFIFNYVLNEKHWYNLILGISIIGVAFTPYLDYPLPHYIFAGVFYVGSVLAISLSSNQFLSTWKYLISAIISIALILHFAFVVFSLLTAEWIGLIPISIHFIIKSIKK